MYQWVWNIDQGFNWYADVGAGVAAWDDNRDYAPYPGYNDDHNGVYVFAAGDIGIEYGFDKVPILLSLDARPEIGSGYYNNDNFGFDVGLGVKFKF